jgi:murein DD-endopeptidase MepM/ murein hydrolase activator NlpD
MSSNPPAVPKPSNAGQGQSAIANTRAAYVNIRNGPGTNYKDIGDIYNNTIAVYYPATRRDGWVWVEQGSAGGWVSTEVVTFENIVSPTPPQQPTPYDGQIGIWHWRGDVLPEDTIEEVVRNLKAIAPYVTQLWVKTSDYSPKDGARWQGHWDTNRNLAIDGPQSIDRWVEVLSRYGMEFHAWCVPRGLDVNGETDLIIQACSRPGVKSMILDIEPYAGFWSGGKEGVRPFMTRIRRALPGAFHIGMGVDPRKQHFNTIFPREWFPFIQSIHPMVYWETFQRDPEAVLAETYQIWGNYGRPIIPILQGDADPKEMNAAITLATQRHGARGLSWWRLGVIGPTQWKAINQPVRPGQPVPPPVEPAPGNPYGQEQVVRPRDRGFSSGSYTGQQEFQVFQGTWGWEVFYKATEPQTSKAWAQWSPILERSGKYEISTFVPTRHATTQNARFKIHGVKGAATEIVVTIDQARFKNQWVTLGVYEIDRNAVNAGVVFLNDLTGETGREIAFDAIRWREIRDPSTPPTTPEGMADGYDSPVGTDEERRSDKVWPGQWLDASPFGRLYFVGTPSEAYHTGADLNLPRDADAHDPVYASASGVVTFASRLPTWGNVIVIKHDPLVTDGKVLYGRYAHVEEMLVKVGDRVKRGQQIAKVGNAFGQWAYHLHFDLSPTTLLESKPGDWPAKDRTRLLKNYIDPKEFIINNRPKKS